MFRLRPAPAQGVPASRDASALVWPILAAALVAFASLLLAHGNKPWPVPKEASARKNPVPSGPASLKEGQALYEKECAVCHGAKGDGQGPGAKVLQVPPANFTDAHMMQEMTDGEIFYKLSEGRMPMPAFKTKLSEEQRWHLVNYVRAFSRKSAAKRPPAKKAGRAQ